jgi:hypothetical protein
MMRYRLMKPYPDRPTEYLLLNFQTQTIPWASKRLPTVNRQVVLIKVVHLHMLTTIDSTWSATIPKTLQSGEYILRRRPLRPLLHKLQLKY